MVFGCLEKGGIAMATERPKERPIGQSIASAPSLADAKNLDNSLVSPDTGR
jgi:hypothetical protein